MADLDDFFAKKDRKKKSKKGFSIANTDILAKNLEENDRKEAKADKAAAPLATSEANKAQAAAHEVNSAEPENEAEEWKTLDDEKKDYSNLKIEALKVESGSEAEEEVEHEMNDEGEMVPVKKSDGGPWNKQQLGEAGAGVYEPSEKERKEAAKAELEANIGAPKGSVVGGSYVPPHLRGGGGGGGGGGQSTDGGTAGGPRRRPAPPPPDLSSQVYFPSLSATVSGPGDGESTSKGNDFEEVKHGNTQHVPKSSAGSAVALDNKFSALRN